MSISLHYINENTGQKKKKNLTQAVELETLPDRPVRCQSLPSYTPPQCPWLTPFLAFCEGWVGAWQGPGAEGRKGRLGAGPLPETQVFPK